MKTRYYIVDSLTYDKGFKICKIMRSTVPELEYITFDETAGIVTVLSKKDLKSKLAMACDVAGCVIRVEIKKKQT